MSNWKQKLFVGLKDAAFAFITQAITVLTVEPHLVGNPKAILIMAGVAAAKSVLARLQTAPSDTVALPPQASPPLENQ